MAILYNSYGQESKEGEAFVTDHIFSYLISGTQEVWSGNQTYVFHAGDYRFFKRNQLTKYVKRPGQHGFRSIAVHIGQDILLEMAAGYDQHPYQGKDIALLTPNAFLESYVNSLHPYINATGPLADLKTKELILLLIQAAPVLKDALFNFEAPGKTDLAAFMHTHYRYNVGLDRMAYLTGRSLSTFKRDFKTIFNTTAGKWLTSKRLEEANYLIEQKGMMASAIYLDLGFEDLSHFSNAYKKAFGRSPSQR